MPLQSNNIFRLAKPMLGTLVEIEVSADSSEDLEAVDAAFSVVARIEQLLSFHDEQSDVSRINTALAGHPLKVDPLTYQVLEYANILSDLSYGSFDVTTAPVLVASGFLSPPKHASAPDTDVNFRDLELGPG